MKEIIDLILSLFGSKKEKKVDKPLLQARAEEIIVPEAIPEIISITYKNGSERLRTEHKDLLDKNPNLYKLMDELNQYINETFNKSLIVTMIYRTQAEQDYLYRNSEKYKKRKFKSPHQFWHAVDIRSSIFSQSEINQIVVWLNDKFDDINYYKWTAKCHDVGSGMHFHIQFWPK